MATKRILTAWDKSGETIYCVVKKLSTGDFLDPSDGAFKAAPATFNNVMAADSTITRLYQLDEARTVWTNGDYKIVVFRQVAGSANIATDPIIASGIMTIATDDGTFRIDGLPSSMWIHSSRTLTDINTLVKGLVLDKDFDIDFETTVIDYVRGDERTLTFNLGSTWDLTDKVVYFMAKNNPADADGSAVIDKTGVIVDASNGVASVSLAEADTAVVANLYAELEIRDDVGDTTPQTASQFRLNIVQDIRQG